ncbi:MAG: sugar nucleotide-binding protein [Candidatus Aegiribacteria sp.]|nr:sugar nucleotide-binding protein [Candidatus Aegiribacteria sp.]
MTILILGGDGMLGHKVFQVFSKDMETHATFLSQKEYDSALPVFKDIPTSRIHLDINVLNDSAVENVIHKVKPDLVLNCIGLIKQLEEASDHTLAIRLNSLLPHKLATLCSECDARLVHISTDCVFSGRKGNYTEDDPTDALDLYGKSKALGEVDYAPHLTIRTSIIGREWVRSTALMEWFLSQEGKTVRGYKNALYTGFTTEAIARLMKRTVLERPDITGLWQVSSAPITKLDLLTRIRDAWKLDIAIEPFDDTPCDRSLNSERFFNETGFERPSWDSMIDELVMDKTPYEEWRKRNADLAKQ